MLSSAPVRTGNELFHIYAHTPDGESKDLTPGEENRATFAGWLEDDAHFLILSNERDPRYMDLYRYQTDGYERELIFKNEGGYSVGDVSRDGRWVALTLERNNADNNVYLYDSANPEVEPKLITPHEGNISFGIATFSPECDALHYMSNEGSEFDRVWAYDLESGAREMIQEADWDIMFTSFSRKGNYRVTGVNADARTKITIINTKTNVEMSIPTPQKGDISGVTFSPSEKMLAFYINSDTSPSNLYVHNFASTTSHTTRSLSRSLSPKIDETQLVASEVVRYPSFDGLAIPALLYKPKTSSPDMKVPALVWVHGGPGGQSRSGYSANIQYLVNHGYAILAVNNRGSSGYGKTFFHMDDLKHGDVDLKDCIHGRTYLEGLDWVDGDRIGILGGSYGGYMVAAALAFEPDAFDVGVDIFGVTNWIRTLKSIPPWWESFRESLYAELGDPEKEEERLRRISPLFHAKNITKPLLVIQGANDPRVLKVESDELVEAVQANNVPVEYIVFDDEGHGFTVKENRITAAMAYRDFLDRYLKNN